MALRHNIFKFVMKILIAFRIRSGGGVAAKKDVEMQDESSKQENQAVKVSNLNEYHDVILHGIKGVQLGHHHGPPRKKERLLDEIEEYMTPEPIPLDALLDMEKPEVILQRCRNDLSSKSSLLTSLFLRFEFEFSCKVPRRRSMQLGI